MRNIIYTSFAIICFFSCSKQPENNNCFEIEFNNKIEFGFTQANSNLMDWSDAGAIFNNSPNSLSAINLRLGKPNDEKCDYYEIDLNNLPLIESKFDLNLLNLSSNFNSNLTILHGGDAIAEQYELVDTFNNYLVITDIKPDLIIGEYSLAFKVSDNSIGRGLYDTSLPNVLYFKNGIFSAKLIK
jgi:hypothetical protein